MTRLGVGADRTHADAGIVDETVDAAEMRHGLFDRGLAFGFDRHIRRQQQQTLARAR